MKRAPFLVLLILIAAQSVPAEERSEDYLALRPLLAAELEARRIECPDDLYKFLFQSVMGPGHAISSAAAARRWLEREWKELSELDEEAVETGDRGVVLTPLRGDGVLVRLHLQAARDSLWACVVGPGRVAAEEGLRERILAAFLQTATIWQGDIEHLQRLWGRIVADEALWADCFTAAACSVLTAEVSRAGWPAVHHSEAYKQRWAPHYRVIAAELWSRGEKEQP